MMADVAENGTTTTTGGAGLSMPESFIDADAAYLAWLRTHPRGYVVNSERKPRAAYVMLRRALWQANTAPTGERADEIDIGPAITLGLLQSERTRPDGTSPSQRRADCKS